MDKTMKFGNSTTTVHVESNGHVVGSNIRSKGDTGSPVYFNADGDAVAVSLTNISELNAFLKSDTAKENSIATTEALKALYNILLSDIATLNEVGSYLGIN